MKVDFPPLVTFIFLFFATSLSSQTIFWSEEGGVIKSKNLGTGSSQTIIDDGLYNQILGIYLDRENQRIFFSVPTETTSAHDIMVVDYNGENLTVVGQSNFDVSAIFYDNELDLIFYKEDYSNGSELNSLDGEGNTETISFWDSNDDCRLMSYNPIEKKFYFIASDSLQSMNVDGTEIEPIFFVPDLIPAPLPPSFITDVTTIDPHFKEIYWSTFEGTISQSNLIKSSFYNLEPDTLFQTSPSLDTSGLFLKPVIDPANSRLYTIVRNNVLPFDIYRVLRRSNLDGSNVEILDEVFSNIQDYTVIGAWEIDPSYENLNLAVKHYHYLPDHPTFDDLTYLNTAIVNSISLQEFKICADGSDASIFEISNPSSVIEQGDYILRIEEDPNGNNPEIYGTFTSLTPSSDEVITLNYIHPEYIASGINGDYIHLEIVETSTGDVKLTIPIALYYPPTLLVHGLNSDGESFKELQKYIIDNDNYPLELTYKVDYKSTNDEEFEVNSAIIPSHTDGIISEVIFCGYSAGQVNIVAHSMGGILSRLYLQSNFYLNEINKLITVNTPHSGTQLPNYILDPNSNAIIGACLAMLVGTGGNCLAGAVGDLRVDSEVVRNELNGNTLNFNVVPSHAIVTTYNLSVSEVIGIGFLLGTSLPVIFDGMSNDIVVPLESQLGGLSSQNISPFDGRHDGSYNIENVRSRISQLLKYNSNEIEFAQNGFSPATLSYEYQPITPPNFMIGTLNIESSFENQTINYGDDIDIQITSNSSNDLVTLIYNGTNLFGSRDSTEEFSTGNISISRELKPSRLGKIPITAFGVNQIEETISSDTFIIDVTSNEIPLNIKGTPTIAFIGKRVSPSIWADFGEYNLSVASATGIQYDFKNGLAEYIGNGYIMPLQAGIDTFTVTFNGVTSPEFRIRISDGTITRTKEVGTKRKKHSKKFELTVFPNPATNQINVSTDVDKPAKYWVKIADATGRTVFREKDFALNPNSSNLISVSHLPKGIYFITLYNRLGNSTVKFIKQ